MKTVNNAIKKLVRESCACFTENNGCMYCPNGQPKCNFFRDDPQAQPFIQNGDMRCFYFEKHVLPANPALEAAYFNRSDAKDSLAKCGRCGRCGEDFVKASNAAKYCGPCRDARKREAARDRMRRKYWREKAGVKPYAIDR
jgi:hypothetical protein